MPVVRGCVNGRIVSDRVGDPHTRAERRWIPWDEWERRLAIKWRKQGVGVEEIARRLMRPVSQIVGFDPVRPNGRRSDAAVAGR